ncbi:hypothetical protein AB7M42_002078 [Bradyrhizobium diazoefficiens]
MIDVDRVRLTCMRSAARTRHRNIDRMIDHHGSVHYRTRKITAAPISGAVVAARDHAGAQRRTDAPTRCNVVVAAMAADAGHLKSGLIDIQIVGLVG